MPHAQHSKSHEIQYNSETLELLIPPLANMLLFVVYMCVVWMYGHMFLRV